MNKRSINAKNNVTEVAANPVSFLRDLWLGTCARYTVFCILILLIKAIAADSITGNYVDTVHFFLLLPFALCVTFAARARKSDKLSTGVKCVLHPLCFLGGFYLFCYLPFQISTKPSGQQVLILLLLVAFLYGVCMGIYCLIAHKVRQHKVDETPYVSQYGKK